MKECKIVISDEVNCKLLGLDLSTRKKLVNKFKYQVPYARHLPSVKLGRWDGCVSFAQLGGSTYINLLSELIPLIEEDGYDIELVDNRTYSNTFEFTQITEDSLSAKNWPKGHPQEGTPILLRDYQVAAVNECLHNLQSLHKLPTGSGKTIITAVLSMSVEQYGRSIVIVPNKDLVKQTEADYINIGLDVGVYFGDRKEWNKTHTICTWQSLNNLLKNSKSGEAELTIKDFVDGVVCIMVDECFDGDVKVLTPTGYVPIKTIKAGDQIVNYSEDTKEFKVDTVIKQHTNLTTSVTEKMYSLVFDNGATVKVTGNHKFLTTHGWVRADELTEEHEIISKT